ncbi:hypothetical protein CVT25_000965 [Psilocybe cyanescens]|uniref:Uncharacterized protein n=1 Tax=Psilocybe cyanescens TaxID=93625 RepID=A0A409VTI7_PSICY|nr:hypothetical protein CVT25_000965 [Psilocybe cyanescens]
MAPPPPIPELQRATTRLVRNATKQGTLGQLTRRIIRQMLEQQMGLEEGVLDAPKFRVPIKEATLGAIKPDQDAKEQEEDEEVEGTSKTKGKGKGKPKGKEMGKIDTSALNKKKRASNGKPKSAVVGDGDDEDEAEYNEDEEKEEEEGVPDSSPRKPKRAVKDEDGNGEDSLSGSPVKKRRVDDSKAKAKPTSKSNSTPKTTPKSKPESTAKSKPKPKSNTVVSESEEEEDVVESEQDQDKDDYEEEEPQPKQKQKQKQKQKKVETPKPPISKAKGTANGNGKGKQKDNNSNKFKSLEHVPTSDMEQDEPDDASGPSSSKNQKPAAPQTKKPVNKKPDPTPRKAAAPAKPSSSSKPKPKPDVIEAEDESGNKSDTGSELSVLIDEPPKKKRKSTSGAAEKVRLTLQLVLVEQFSDTPSFPPYFLPTKKENDQIKLEENLLQGNNDIDIDKRRRHYQAPQVVACGTRKVWSRFLQGCDTPQQQVRKLKETLGELGMTGRFSMDQAKAIKAKREFEQELEDVQEFEQKILGRTSRSRSGAATKGASSKSDDEDEESAKEKDKDEDDDEDDDEEAAPPRRKNARASIMAFLQDQSDEE